MGTTGIILAGGKSLRLGVDKAGLTLGQGRSLLEQVAEKLSPLCEEILLVGSQTEVGGLKSVPDAYPGLGSLGGIYSGLLAASFSYGLVVACDMPFLNPPLLNYMVSYPRDYDVLIPRLGEELEPLHAIYGKACLEPMRELLVNRRLKIIAFFPKVRVRYLEEAEVNRFDPQHLSFFNINTLEELAEAWVLQHAEGR